MLSKKKSGQLLKLENTNFKQQQNQTGMWNRREFLKRTSLGTLAMASTGLANQGFGQTNNQEKLGVALVGLGNYATNQLAPALMETDHCELVAVVTGTKEKEKVWAEKYNIPTTHIYNYDNYDQIKDNPDIDIVYVVLPNSMHAEYSIRAAKAGKHVICEKPMEISSARAQSIVDACKEAGVLLQVGYRLRYDPWHLEMMRLGQEKVFGQVKLIDTHFSFYGINSENWRFTDASLSGGGPLMDIGVYCIEGACYTLGELPTSITAQSFKTVPNKMPDMEETILFQMEFPSGAVAHCASSYVARSNYLRAMAEKGNFSIDTQAYMYHGQSGMIKNEPMDIKPINQQAAQMDAFALNIKNDTPVIASGEIGVMDMKIIEAIYGAAESGDTVGLKW